MGIRNKGLDTGSAKTKASKVTAVGFGKIKPLTGASFKKIVHPDAPAQDVLITPYPTLSAQTSRILDELHASISTTNTVNTSQLNALYTALRDEFHLHSEAEWTSVIKHVILDHPIKEFIFQDPCTQHSFSQPRGYAGDADLIDYFYKNKNSEAVTTLAKALQAFTTRRPAGKAVLHRMHHIASIIDHHCTGKNARILSLACGHLREARVSHVIDAENIEELVAFDHDPRSLQLIDETYQNPKIKTVQGSVFDLLRPSSSSKYNLGKYDFVYASGLYDYLSLRSGARLLEFMFHSLKPGGKLLITNFVHSIDDIGYMSTFMNWTLVLREVPDMDLLTANIPQDQIAEKIIVRDQTNTLLTLTLKKCV